MPLLFAFCNNTQVENMFSTKSGFEHHSPVNQLALIFLLVINQLWYDGTLDDWKKKLIGKLGLINLPRQNIWWKSSGFCENLFSKVTAAHTSILFNLPSQKYWNLKMQIQMKSVIESDYTMQSNPSQLVIMKLYFSLNIERFIIILRNYFSITKDSI